MGRFEADVMAAMDGKAEGVIEARERELEGLKKTLRGAPWESREELYRRLRELREELDVIKVVAS